MHNYRDIANAFIRIAKDQSKTLTNMQVQKLVYFAHGWYLALTPSHKELIGDPVKAWPFGPVIIPLYEDLRKYGGGIVKVPIAPDESEMLEEPMNRFLRQIFTKYGKLTGFQMSELTHKPGTPWAETWHKREFGVIPNDLIRDHFNQLRKDAKRT